MLTKEFLGEKCPLSSGKTLSNHLPSPSLDMNESIAPAGFPGGSDSKVSVCNAGDLGSIPGSGRSPGEGKGNPLQYSCLESPMDRGAWWATVHGVAKSWTLLNDFTSFLPYLLIALAVVNGQPREPKWNWCCQGLTDAEVNLVLDDTEEQLSQINPENNSSFSVQLCKPLSLSLIVWAALSCFDFIF